MPICQCSVFVQTKRRVRMNTPEVLEPLAPWLSVGDIFRLHRALGREPAWPCNMSFLVLQKMNLKTGGPRARKAKLVTMAMLSTYMAQESTRRCVECGCTTRARPRVCFKCTQDQQNIFAMSTRREIVHRNRFEREVPLPNLLRRIRTDLPIVKRGHVGAFYYWTRDVDRLLR